MTIISPVLDLPESVAWIEHRLSRYRKTVAALEVGVSLLRDFSGTAMDEDFDGKALDEGFFVSISARARQLGISEQRCRRGIRALLVAGVIAQVEDSNVDGVGQYRPNWYRFGDTLAYLIRRERVA